MLTIVNATTGARTPATTADQILAAYKAGNALIDDKGNIVTAQEVGNPAGGFIWLFNGCPADVWAGGQMSADEQATVNFWATMLQTHGWTGCINLHAATTGGPGGTTGGGTGGGTTGSSTSGGSGGGGSSTTTTTTTTDTGGMDWTTWAIIGAAAYFLLK